MIVEECFHRITGETYNSIEFKNKLKKSRGINRELLLVGICCPYCRKAKGEFIYNREKSHFRIFNDHENSCPLLKEEYSQDEITKNIKKGYTQFIEKGIEDIISYYSGERESFIISNKKKLPQHNFNTPFRRSNLSKFQLFYGQAVISNGYENGQNCLILSDFSDKNIICKLKMTDMVNTYLGKTINKIKNEPHFICFFAEFNMHPVEAGENKNGYYVGTLINSRFFDYR